MSSPNKLPKHTTNFNGDLVCVVVRRLVEFRKSAILGVNPGSIYSSEEWVVGVVTKVDPMKGRTSFGEFTRSVSYTQRLFSVMTGDGVVSVVVEATGSGREATLRLI